MKQETRQTNLETSEAKLDTSAMKQEDSVFGQFARYVFQSVMGMIGISVYILADTYFISVANGADGITTLNLALPIYSFIFALGSMIGVGAATRFSIDSATGNPRSREYFSNSIIWCLIFALPIILIGATGTVKILKLMGADETIIKLGLPYLRIVFLFSPFFLLNYVFNAFTRNDGAPTLAMVATLSSCAFNIVFDYIFIFPCGMGMTGAALATCIAPMLGCMICSIHIFSRRSTVHFFLRRPSVSMLLESCSLGIPAFVGEFASGITTIVFNTLILSLTGNTGVAAYGVIANISLVVIAIFNGISQGGQPLMSNFYGLGERKKQEQILRLSMVFAVISSCLIIACAWIFTGPIVSVFNSEHNPALQLLAERGMRIYFLGSLAASVNIVATGYFGATDQPFWSSLISMLRGMIVILVCAVLMAMIWGMDGLWAAFPATEMLVLALSLYAIGHPTAKK